jgi:undecaprenyl-diphosphatase
MILTSDQLSVLIKDATVRFRPVHDPVIGPLVHNILRKGSLYGFVSSHAANSFAIFAFTSLIFKNRWFTLLIILWALLFSYSRIYAGMHYPLDIICGAVLGWLVGIGFYKILMFTDNHYFNKRSPQIQITHLKNSDAAVIIVVFTVLLSTVVITASVLHKYGYLQ